MVFNLGRSLFDAIVFMCSASRVCSLKYCFGNPLFTWKSLTLIYLLTQNYGYLQWPLIHASLSFSLLTDDLGLPAH